jgi:hypothetical protein
MIPPQSEPPMKLCAEHARRMAEFPGPLRTLLERELAAGNEIAEFCGGHPAPPAGDCLKLARQVTTRPRASGDGLQFRERNSSLWSGEFTDERGFYFILEPPCPPPEPDMDGIRRAYAGTPDALAQFAETREIGAGLGVGAEIFCKRSTEPDFDCASSPTRALIACETATGAKRLLHFKDKRPPHEIQFALERELMTLFTVEMIDERLNMQANSVVVGAHYSIQLRFEAALLNTNNYSLRIETSWAHSTATHHDYYRKTSDTWFSLWTRDLIPANPPAADASSPKLYGRLCEEALRAEAHLDSLAAIQEAIVAGLKRGGRFGTAHKEGGTNIFWRDGKFIRCDYGDYPDLKEFTDEAEFLKMLGQFCHWDVMRNAGTEGHSDFDTWKLILRRLQLK